MAQFNCQVCSGQSIATVSNGVIINESIDQKLHSFSTHWILSPEGTIATADALGTNALAAGAVILIIGALMANGAFAIRLDDGEGTVIGLPGTESVGQFLCGLGDRVCIWSHERTTNAFTEAKKNVFNRHKNDKNPSFTLKPLKGRIMPINTTANNVQPLSVGQQLSNDEEPICPVTLNAIPFKRRAISLTCSDLGMPSATIYDRDALFNWLNTSHIDPTNRKEIKCVIDGNGSIIYPVKIESEIPQNTNRSIPGTAISRRILAPGRPPMPMREIEERKTYRKVHSEAILERFSRK